MSTRFIQVCAAALLAVASVASLAEQSVVVNLDVFVDPPTGFAFVKMPQGWKFVGKLDAQAMRQLPSSVHTSLPQGADHGMSRVAQGSPERLATEVVYLPSQFQAPVGQVEMLPARF